MNKVENIYWGRSGARSTKPGTKGSQPRWVAPLVAASLSIMVCLTINYRAYSELNKEIALKQSLIQQIESVKGENLDLQEDIYKLRSDPKTIKLEARKLGFRDPK